MHDKNINAIRIFQSTRYATIHFEVFGSYKDILQFCVILSWVISECVYEYKIYSM